MNELNTSLIGNCELANNVAGNIGVVYRKTDTNLDIFADMDVYDNILMPLDFDDSVITVTDDSYVSAAGMENDGSFCE